VAHLVSGQILATIDGHTTQHLPGDYWTVKDSASMKVKVIGEVAVLETTVAILALGGPAGAIEARYRCSGGAKLTAQFSPPSAAKGRVALTFGKERKITLPQVLSADGGRYADDGIEFWIKGHDATLTMNGKRETCSTQ
jgi:membrane-bound inhibitor of C-type lysozyme